MPELRRTVLNLSQISPASYNPRRIDAASMQGLTKSIEHFGLVQEFVVNEKQDGTFQLISGHQRMKALKQRGEKTAPCVIVKIDEQNEKALNIAMNSGALAGTYTDDLQGLLAEIESANEQLFADLRLDQLLAELAPSKLLGDPDDVPDVPGVAITQPGDVWTLGRHRLICGDSADPAVIKALLGDERVDCLVTDPPYGVDYGAKNEFMREYARFDPRSAGDRIEKRIENDVATNYRQFFGAFLKVIPWAEYATFYVFMSDREAHNVRNAIDDLGWKFGALLAWIKNVQVFGRTDYAFKHELIVYGWPERHRFYGATNRTTVLECDKPTTSRLHPTMKPVSLLEQLLSDGSADGAIILDSFGGSGSTLIACEMSKRSARLVEIDCLYNDVTAQRFCDLTGKSALLNGQPQDKIVPRTAAK